jgi:hypothetical protein
LSFTPLLRDYSALKTSVDQPGEYDRTPFRCAYEHLRCDVDMSWPMRTKPKSQEFMSAAFAKRSVGLVLS